MIHKSNPYNVKPLPKIKYFSFGKFGKGSAVNISRQKELKRKPKTQKIKEKKIENVFCWGNKSGEFKVLERKVNFGAGRKEHIKIKQGW